MKKQDAILLGPCVGEFYWETGRFAPLLPALQNKYKNRDIKYIIYTRAERFDLYGKNADILIPLKIPGDYENKTPDCFRLKGFGPEDVKKIAKEFNKKYEEKYNIIEHIYPNVMSGKFSDKKQFARYNLIYNYEPRDENYILVDDFIPKNGNKNIVISPRYRNGFQRNWNGWDKFYNLLSNEKSLMNKFNFIICGKPGEYIPDHKHRFLDMNDIPLSDNLYVSLVGLLLVILERSVLTFGSQSAIPNISLLKGVEVLEFGHQKQLHTKTYNIKNTPITFIENTKYDISPEEIFKIFKTMLIKHL